MVSQINTPRESIFIDIIVISRFQFYIKLIKYKLINFFMLIKLVSTFKQ